MKDICSPDAYFFWAWFWFSFGLGATVCGALIGLLSVFWKESHD